MMKQLMTAGVLSAGLVFASVSAAAAAPLPATKSTADSNIVVDVRKGGHGGGRGGFARGGGGFGGGKAFRGGGGFGGGKAFRGGRSFGGGGLGPRRSFRHSGGGKHWHGGKGHRHHKHRHHRRFYGGYYPYYYGAYYGSSYYGDCGWLRRRAIRTGSSYWWRRYEACVDGYY